MLFNSIEFAFFLPIVFLIYWAIGYAHINDTLKLRLQNAFVLVASYIFYGWWDWRFLLLIAFTSLCSYASGLLIKSSIINHQSSISKLWLTANIVLNLGILFTFKYYNFFIDEFCQLFHLSPFRGLGGLSLILPVGISFYTFQALSYSIDVYRRKIEPTKDIIAFFAFIAFFPQLVAGPIERATNLLPQFLLKRTFSYDQGVDGMRQILWGLFKKIVVADNCATYVDQVWATYDTQTGSTLLLAAVLFAFQIYGDFSGYSDIAIGTAKLFGIKLMRNFNNPYFSRDIAEFWRRWHISLTTWFRDYVYIPLGGSRINKRTTMRNTFIVFLLCGLWHGASWTYIAWGVYHALLFVPLILLGRKNGDNEDERAILKIVCTFVFVVFGWILFRSESILQSWYILRQICSHTLWSLPYWGKMGSLVFTAIAIVLMMGIEYLQRNRSHGLELHFVRSRMLRYTVYVALIAMMLWSGNQGEAFIYFQF